MLSLREQVSISITKIMMNPSINMSDSTTLEDLCNEVGIDYSTL